MSMADPSVTPGALFVEGQVDADRRRSKPDDRFFRRLVRALREAFIDVAADGIPVLREAFVRLDKSIDPSNFEADIWRFKALLKAPTGLSDKDLELLFTDLHDCSEARIEPSDDEPGPMLDLAEVMVYFRRVIGHPTAQFHAILKRLRSRRPSFADSPFNLHAIPSKLEIYDYLVKLKLTQSEAFWVMEQCSSNRRAAAVAERADAAVDVDVDYMVNCLFEFPLPDDIAYPILLSKVVECVSDRYREYNGIAGVRHVMRRVLAGAHGRPDPFSPTAASSTALPDTVTPPPKRVEHHRFTRGEETQNRENALRPPSPPQFETVTPVRGVTVASSSGRFDRASFRLFTSSFGAGLSAAESDVLFQYVCDTKSSTLDAESFVQLISQRIPLLPRDELMSVIQDVRNAVISATFGGLCDLHVNLHFAAPEGGPIPIAAYCAALRKSGVFAQHASDIDLEHLHREAPSATSLVLMLRGSLSPSRESVLQKLFLRLDPERTGLVLREKAYILFDPASGDPRVCTRAAERRERFAMFLKTLPSNDAMISYGEFSYFWGNVSASFNDDATFVMLMWQAYGMQRDGTKMTAGKPSASTSRRRSPTRSPERMSAASASPRNAVRTSVAIVRDKTRDAPITSAVPLGDDSSRPVSRRRAVPGARI